MLNLGYFYFLYFLGGLNSGQYSYFYYFIYLLFYLYFGIIQFQFCIKIIHDASIYATLCMRIAYIYYMRLPLIFYCNFSNMEICSNVRISYSLYFRRRITSENRCSILHESMHINVVHMKLFLYFLSFNIYIYV